MAGPVAPKIAPFTLAELDDGAPDEITTGETYDRVRFAEPTVKGRDLSGVTFSECELAGWEVRDAVFTDSAFLETRISALFATGFRECVLDGIDAGDATLTRVAFEDCRAAEIDLTRAKLQDVDLRGLQVERIRGLEGIAGATMSHLQVVALSEVFAAHLGVHVTD